MEGTTDELPSNHNLKCHVCGENHFEEREGFYYCQECGTKQEQVRLVEIDRDDEFDQQKLKAKQTKIHVTKSDKPQLTSWECYNYILRGFVEELILLGAKEELKLMTLQVWAAYLRRMEVAFFSRKHLDLPKFGIKYFKADAAAIYNHSSQAKRRRRRRRSAENSCTSGDESRSARSLNKSKRKLDESIYSTTSATSSGVTSSTSANSNKAIKITFNSKARAYFKKKIPLKHLEKHALDAEGLLTCHKQPKARELNRAEYNMMLINMKQIYSILAIALNLISDEIQLSDLVRFINEGHIGTSNVLQYFPENIANHGKEMLTKINFYKCSEKYSDKVLRDHIGLLCKSIGITTLKNPDILQLVRRYITDLCLPKELAFYIERLINLLPPNFNNRGTVCYPGFEARAMAYIMFTLKIFFGLDDSKEKRISQASKKLNSKIENLNLKSHEKQPLLFVWNEWVEYIEMRKIIISQLNTNFCQQFKQHQSKTQLIEQFTEETRKTHERNSALNDKTENLQFTLDIQNLKLLLERFQENYKCSSETNNQQLVNIEFKPSLTPALSYLKNILLLYDGDTNVRRSIKVPDLMRTDHSQRDIRSYLQVKPLIEYFKKHQLKLNVYSVAIKENKNFVGIFRAPHRKSKEALLKACFNISEEEWMKNVADRYTENMDSLEFCTNLKTDVDPADCEQNNVKLKRKKLFNPSLKHDNEHNQKMPKGNLHGSNCIQHKNKQPGQDVKPVHSFELFSENNMEPIDNPSLITNPRKNLEVVDLFEGISDEESILNSDDAIIADNCESVILNRSESLLSSLSEEFVSIKSDSRNYSGLVTSNENEKNSSICNNSLKMYISSMDCWTILGFCYRITNTQKCQLQAKFPRSFNWLLETCAQTINVEWIAVYEQLLILESMFCLGINDPKTIKNCVFMNSDNPSKKIQSVINSLRETW